MSKLNVDQKTIKDLFQDKKAYFLIPDYQRPYAWEENECHTLWNDIQTFAIPDNDATKFDPNEEYYLGPIVTFKNEKGQMEVIDGQQRLTTLLLLLRAIYDKFGQAQDEDSVETKKNIGRCIWKTNEIGTSFSSLLKIDSQVATDQEKEDFLTILRTGEIDEKRNSNYAKNFRFFTNKVEEFRNILPTYLPFLAIRILQNCILLPIEAESQDTALRIFSTLNDRGKPLSDSDIFKAKFYKYYSKEGKKDFFIEEWKKLDERCNAIFHPITGTPMDDLFTRYMYFIRAKQDIKSSTTESLRKFYELNKKLLETTETFENLIILADFWNDITIQAGSRFSDRILKRLFVLNYAPNSMWTYIVSVYFLQNRDENNLLDDEKFYHFLNLIIGFIWTYTITRGNVNALRTPVYAEMINIVNNKPATFSEFKFNKDDLKNQMNLFHFVNNRPITKSMVIWNAFQDEKQELLELSTPLDTEHIYPTARKIKENNKEESLKNVDSLGNKVPLERRINIRASDYRFEDKKKYYQGYAGTRSNQSAPTRIAELQRIAKDYSDFTEDDIRKRKDKIIRDFIAFLNQNGLIA